MAYFSCVEAMLELDIEIKEKIDHKISLIATEDTMMIDRPLQDYYDV